MRKRLIGYVVLDSCDELVAWQQANKGCDIIAITPMVSGLRMQFDNPAKGEFAEGKTGLGVFVTFVFASTKKEG